VAWPVIVALGAPFGAPSGVMLTKFETKSNRVKARALAAMRGSV
jgi:hypothetical protein